MLAIVLNSDISPIDKENVSVPQAVIEDKTFVLVDFVILTIVRLVAAAGKYWDVRYFGTRDENIAAHKQSKYQNSHDRKRIKIRFHFIALSLFSYFSLLHRIKQVLSLGGVA